MKNDKDLASARCFVCRLPTDVKDALHRERFENYRTFDELAQWLSSNGYDVSESSLRRHFRRHALPPLTDSTIEPLGGDATNSGNEATPFDELIAGPVSERRVLEASVKAILAKIRASEHRSRAFRSDGLSQFLKLHGALDRSLKQLRAARAPIREAQAIYGKLCEVVAGATGDAAVVFMTLQTERLERLAEQYVAGRIDGGQFVRGIKECGREWREDFSKRVKEEVVRALRTDEGLEEWRSLPSA